MVPGLFTKLVVGNTIVIIANIYCLRCVNAFAGDN